MGWFMRDRRAVSWTDQTLQSISAPPAPLVVFFGLVMMLLILASYSDYKAQMEKTKIGLRLSLFLIPLVLVLVVYLMMAHRWFTRRLWSPAAHEMIRDEGGSPLGLALCVVLLLVMVHYQSSFQNSWFRSF